MKQERLKIINYKVTGDHKLMDEQNHITPEVRGIIEKIYPEVEMGKKSLIRKLNDLCLKYPKVPVFKNMLSSVYMLNGEEQQAYSVNQWLVREHPDYLFGKLNLAAEQLQKEEIEEVPKILGKAMELSQLYPNRKEFHLEEVIGFNELVVRYFLAVDRIKEAELRVKLMEDLAADHTKSQQARQQLQNRYFEKAAARREEESKLRKNAVLKDNRSQVQTALPPEFHFPEQLAWLYQHDLSLGEEKIEQLLALNPIKLKEDLEKVLHDSILRFDHFSGDPIEEKETYFPIHALLLLSALKSEGSLPIILQLLQQDKDYTEFWFGDLLPELLENAFVHCGKDQPEILFEFLKLPNVPGLHKGYVGEALAHLVQASPEKRGGFVDQYREVLHTFIENATDENYIDTEAIGFVISDLTNLGFQEVAPEIEQLFDLQLVDSWICGDYSKVKRDIQGKNSRIKSKFSEKSVFEKYKTLNGYLQKPAASQQMSEPDHKADDQGIRDHFFNNEPIVKPQKIGRNDPCPCGSGKKYKKCCLN